MGHSPEGRIRGKGKKKKKKSNDRGGVPYLRRTGVCGPAKNEGSRNLKKAASVGKLGTSKPSKEN